MRRALIGLVLVLLTATAHAVIIENPPGTFLPPRGTVQLDGAYIKCYDDAVHAKTVCKAVTPTPVPTLTPTRVPTATATPTLTPTSTMLPTATPTTKPIDPTLLNLWRGHMTTYGRAACDRLDVDTPGTDQALADTFYDGELVFYQIADYTNDPAWLPCTQRAELMYKAYIEGQPTVGSAAGWYIFTRGLLMDWVRTGDTNSRDDVVALSLNASYASDSTPVDWLTAELRSRETAYNIEAELDAEAAGQPHRARTDQLEEKALGHIDQWLANQSSDGTVPDFAPFMLSLTVHALAEYNAKYPDARILPKVLAGLVYAWRTMWRPTGFAADGTTPITNSFWYHATTGQYMAPDLNLLILPAYWWAYQQTGVPIWRDRADLIFKGGVEQGYLGDNKHFNQQYKWSFDYVKER